MERKFAVVQWSEEEDFGKLREIKTDAIRGYDDSKMDHDGNPISNYSAVIEWCHGIKTMRRAAPLQRHRHLC